MMMGDRQNCGKCMSYGEILEILWRDFSVSFMEKCFSIVFLFSVLYQEFYCNLICYQLLPYMFDVKLDLTKAAPSERSVVLVISPLVNATYFLRYIQPFIMDKYTKYFT